MAEDVRKIVAEFAARDKTAGAITSFEKRLRSVSGTMLRMAGIGGGIYALQRGFSSVVKAALEQEDAVKKLEAALGHTIGTYGDFAKSIQRVTIYGDEEILNQLAYARNLGVTESKLKDATTAAIGLAAKYRIDLQSAMMLIGRASQGQTQMLTRYGIVLDQTMTAEEKFNEILKIGSKAFGLAEEEAKTAAGAFKQWENAASDLKKTLGEKLLPELAEFAKSITFIIQNGPEVARTISEGAESVFREVTPEVEKAAQEMYRRLTGETEAFVKKNSQTLMLGWTPAIEILPKNQMLYRQLLNEQMRIAREQAEAVPKETKISLIPEAQAQIEDARKQMEEAWKLLDERHKANQQMIELEKKMYEQMGDYGIEYQRLCKEFLEEEVYNFKRAKVDEVLIEKWKQDQIIKIQEDAIEKQQKLAIEQAKKTGTFFEGFGAGIEEMERDFPKISEMGADAAKNIQDSMANAFDAMIQSGGKWRDAMRNFCLDVSRSFSRMAADIAAKAIMAGLMDILFSVGLSAAATGAGGYGGTGGGGPTGGGSRSMIGHRGGIVGETLFPQRLVPAPLFANAPRLHEGLRSDEYPAILQRGEQVRSKADVQHDKQSQQPIIIRPIIVHNEREAFEEYIKSPSGEKAVICHVARNSRLLG